MKILKEKLVISIGVSAYNEEQNIKKMLKSICIQEEQTITIKEILVISDGSTDKTVKETKSVKDKRILILEDGKRLGQASRIMMMLKKFEGDVFVLLDADMVMKDNLVVENLVSGFRKDKNINLIGGNIECVLPRTFIENAIFNYKQARFFLEDTFSFESTALGAHAFLAYSRAFGKELNLPENIINPDAFSYFSCKQKGYKFYFEKKATALYRSPQTIKDYINQAVRHIAGGIQLYKYFGKKFIDEGFFIPRSVNMKLMFIQLLKNPLGYIFLKILNLYCVFKARSTKGEADVKWEVINTSKVI